MVQGSVSEMNLGTSRARKITPQVALAFLFSPKWMLVLATKKTWPLFVRATQNMVGR